jgi:translocation and assembly module TamB
MKILRRALVGLGIGLLGLMLLLALAWGVAQTGPGKAALATLLERWLSDPDERVTIDHIGGSVPFAMTVDRITLADSGGPRIVVSDVAIAIGPGDLLAGRLRLRRLIVGALSISRGSHSASTSKTDLGPLLHPPLAVAIEQLRIDRLELGRELVGEPVALTLAAHGDIGGGTAAADLDLHRIDGAAGEARLHFSLDGAPLRLELDADIAEPSGHLLAGWLASPEPLPLSLHLAGDGPLADWHGEIAATAGQASKLAGDVRIHQGGDRYHLAAEGSAQLAQLLPATLRPVIGDDAHFSAAADIAGETITLDALRVRAGAGRLLAQGIYAQDSDAVHGTATLDLPDLSALAPLLQGESRGALTSEIALEGKLDALKVHLKIGGTGLAFDSNGVAQASADIDLETAGDAFAAATPVAVSAKGRVAGVTLAATTLPGDLGRQIDWHAALRLDRQSMTVAVSDLGIDDAGSTLAAEGRYADGAITGEAHLAAPDVARFVEGFPAALALDLSVESAANGTATATLDGKLNPSGSGGSPVEALLGAETTLGARIERLADGTLRARDVRVDGAQIRMEGEGQRGADGQVAATYRLTLPRLAALDERTAGSASLSGDVTGPSDALSGRMTLTASRLAFGSARLDEVVARLDLARLLEPRGRITATFRGGKLSGSASSEAALSKGLLKLERLHIEAAGTRLDGEIALRLADNRIDGTIAAAAPDLRPWSELLGTPVSGSAQVKATLSSARNQTVDATLDGKNLAWGGDAPTTAQRLHATARLSGVFATPSGRADLQLDNARAGTVAITQLRLGGQSAQPGRFAIDGNLHGALAQPFDLALTATTLMSADRIELRVTRLAGTVAGQALQLRQPLLLARRGERLSFADLALGVGPGSLTGAGAVQGAVLSLQLHGDRLPLAPVAAVAGRQDVTGSVGFDLKVSGTRTRPQGEFVVSSDQIRLAAVSRPDLPPLALAVSGTWRGDRVSAQGRVEGPHSAALGFTAALPFTLDPKSLAPRLPPQGAIAFHLEGDGEIANLVDLLPIGEDRLSGHFSLNVSVDGTVAAPNASGRMTLRNGRYESLDLGTVLTGVSFDLVGNRDRLVLQSFTGGDGDRGTLALTGAVNLAAAGGPALDVKGEIQSFHVLRRDEAKVTASGEARVTGGIAAPHVAAKLRVDTAELHVPDRVSPDVQPINVVIINSKTGETLSAAPTETGPKPWLATTLDAAIELPGQIFVRGQGLDSEWRGHLTVTGSTAAPQLAGKLEVVRGTYDFLGKTAALSRGTITFLGGQRIDPVIDIEAQVSTSDVTALIRLSGTARQPKIAISSQPDLPQDEILSRVLFGTSVSQISTAQGLQIAAAAGSLATGGGPGILDRVRQGLGLDRLSLGAGPNSSPLNTMGMPSLAGTPGVPGSAPATGVGTTPIPIGAGSGTSSPTGGAAVSAGKYVANGVYVGVSQGITAQSSSVDVQIDVTRHISIDTTAGQATGAGVGVNWKLDY